MGLPDCHLVCEVYASLACYQFVQILFQVNLLSWDWTGSTCQQRPGYQDVYSRSFSSTAVSSGQAVTGAGCSISSSRKLSAPGHRR